MRNRIFYSILLSLLILQFCGLIFFIKILDIFFTDETFTDMQHESTLLVDVIDDIIKDCPLNFTKHTTNPLGELAPIVHYRITVIDKNGLVLCDNRINADTMENHSNRPEFIGALNHHESFSQHYSNSLQHKSIYYAVLVTRQNGENVVLRLSSFQNSILSIGFFLTPYLSLAVLLFIFISFLVAYILTNRIIKPLKTIDIENLGRGFIYKEFDTFLSKIKSQNKTIKNNIKRIKQKQKEFNILIANMNDGLLLLNPLGEIIIFNRSASILLSNLEGVNNVYEINNRQLVSFISSIIHSSEHKKECVNHLVIAEKYIELIQSPVYMKNKLKGILIFLRDVTKKVELENLQKEFMANVTHDLKTPLTSIMASSEMMKNGLVKSDDENYFLENIYFESKRLLDMLNRILEFSFFDEDVQTGLKQHVDIYDISQRILARIHFIAKQKNIELVFKGERLCVVGVESMLETLFENLIENAIKYSSSHSTISIEITNINNHVQWKIIDQGIGIPKEYHKRVFERFFCVDKSRNKKANGIGLGLSIVQKVAQYHKAKIELESELNMGTTISILFPIKAIF